MVDGYADAAEQLLASRLGHYLFRFSSQQSKLALSYVERDAGTFSILCSLLFYFYPLFTESEMHVCFIAIHSLTSACLPLVARLRASHSFVTRAADGKYCMLMVQGSEARFNSLQELVYRSRLSFRCLYRALYAALSV